MTDCCWKNLAKAKKIGRAHWVCPLCEKDVSLAYVLMRQAEEK